MAYRMPKGYDNDDDGSYSDEGSVAMSVGIDDSTYQSEGEYSEEEEERPRGSRRPPGQSGGARAPPPDRRGGPPRRSKSFQEDTLRSRGGDSGRQSQGRTGERERRPVARSNTFDGHSQSMRGFGGPRMPRRTNSMKKGMDKETIASNRARRLRAMGDAPKGEKVKLLTRSNSFKKEKKLDVGDDDGEDEEKKDETSRRKPPPRSTSNDLAPEERQYARTAARGVTRSKSLKAERPNLEKASNKVASRLKNMGGGGGARSELPSRPTRKGSRNTSAADDAEAKAEPAAAPKSGGGLQW